MLARHWSRFTGGLFLRLDDNLFQQYFSNNSIIISITIQNSFITLFPPLRGLSTMSCFAGYTPWNICSPPGLADTERQDATSLWSSIISTSVKRQDFWPDNVERLAARSAQNCRGKFLTPSLNDEAEQSIMSRLAIDFECNIVAWQVNVASGVNAAVLF